MPGVNPPIPRSFDPTHAYRAVLGQKVGESQGRQFLGAGRPGKRPFNPVASGRSRPLAKVVQAQKAADGQSPRNPPAGLQGIDRDKVRAGSDTGRPERRKRPLIETHTCQKGMAKTREIVLTLRGIQDWPSRRRQSRSSRRAASRIHWRYLPSPASSCRRVEQDQGTRPEPGRRQFKLEKRNASRRSASGGCGRGAAETVARPKALQGGAQPVAPGIDHEGPTGLHPCFVHGVELTLASRCLGRKSSGGHPERPAQGIQPRFRLAGSSPARTRTAPTTDPWVVSFLP